MRTFVVGDVHGAFLALQQCLELAAFNSEQDHLILLGDICDGYPQVKETIDYLITLPHCSMVLGNHDLWAMEWGESGIAPDIWVHQGGRQTIDSYGSANMPQTHIDFLSSASLWLEADNNLFVHGGFDPDRPLDTQSRETLLWDRSLLQGAWYACRGGQSSHFGPWKMIFVGHTPTSVFNSRKPLRLGNLFALDTGAGWSGCLTILDTDSLQWWQSDPSSKLYPGVRARG